MKTVYLSLNFSAKVPSDTDTDNIRVDIVGGVLVVRDSVTGAVLAEESEYTTEPWGEDEEDE